MPIARREQFSHSTSHPFSGDACVWLEVEIGLEVEDGITLAGYRNLRGAEVPYLTMRLSSLSGVSAVPTTACSDSTSVFSERAG